MCHGFDNSLGRKVSCLLAVWIFNKWVRDCRCVIWLLQTSEIVLIYTAGLTVLILMKHETSLGLLNQFIMCWENSLLCYPTVYCICRIKLYMEWMFRLVNVFLWFAESKVWYDYALVYKTLRLIPRDWLPSISVAAIWRKLYRNLRYSSVFSGATHLASFVGAHFSALLVIISVTRELD